MPNKLTYAEVKKNIEKKGHTLLSITYVNGKTPLKYICAFCGKKANQQYHRLIANIGHGCTRKSFTVLHKYKCKYCEDIFYSRRQKRIFCTVRCGLDWKRCTFEGIEENRKNGSKGGKMASKVKRSKNENHFYLLCKEHFKQYNVLSNERMFDGYDADVIIPELKLAIEWNGPWHYKKVHKYHDFNRTHRNDLQKKKKIEKHKYTLYIIKDLRGDENKKFVRNEFNIFKKYVAARENIKENEFKTLIYDTSGDVNPINFERMSIIRKRKKVHRDIKLRFIIKTMLKQHKSYAEISRITKHSEKLISYKANEFGFKKYNLFQKRQNRIKKKISYNEMFDLIHIKKMSYVKIGKLYNVTGNAIKKRCIKMNIL